MQASPLQEGGSGLACETMGTDIAYHCKCWKWRHEWSGRKERKKEKGECTSCKQQGLFGHNLWIANLCPPLVGELKFTVEMSLLWSSIHW